MPLVEAAASAGHRNAMEGNGWSAMVPPQGSSHPIRKVLKILALDQPDFAGVSAVIPGSRARGLAPALRSDDFGISDRGYAARTREKNSPTRPSRSTAAE